MTIMHKACAQVLSLSTVWAVSLLAGPNHRGREFVKTEIAWSPDHRCKVLIRLHRPRLYGTGESRLDVYSAKGRLIASRDYSRGGTQGYKLRDWKWSADGRFFLFDTESSGGHSPWHSPTHFFDRQSACFYSVDALDWAVEAEYGFHLTPPAKLRVTVRGEQDTMFELDRLTSRQRRRAHHGEYERP